MAKFRFPIPPPDAVRNYVERFDELASQTKAVEAIYEQKLTQLIELKQSILQKAFAGELTTARVSAVVTVAVPILKPSLVSITGISTTDLHAGILAIAYQKHQGHPKQRTFGHVKAEKIAHMIEARVGIDLDRSPVKDAAGPNDYPHLKKVESRANKAGFFSVRRSVDTGYSFSQKNRFNDLVSKTRSALGEYNDAVDKIIDLMLPMDTQQAEIFATVFAAWNNLLLDGRPVTDEAIVREAREDWHPKKLELSRKRFFSAIDWMRKNNIVPRGEGKKVMSRTKG